MCRLLCEQVEVDGGLAAAVDKRLGRVRVFRGRRAEGEGRDRGELAVVGVAPAASARRAVRVHMGCRQWRRRGLCREDRIVEVERCGHSAASKLGRAVKPEARELGCATGDCGRTRAAVVTGGDKTQQDPGRESKAKARTERVGMPYGEGGLQVQLHARWSDSVGRQVSCTAAKGK